MPVSDKVVNDVFDLAWEVAVHENPMLLARHSSETVIARTRQAIRELLAQGCSVIEAQERVVKDLLDPRSALYRDPR